MRSRLVVVVVLFLGLLAGGVGGAQAVGVGGNTTAETGDWGCVVVRTVNQGLCLSNPLPDRLPLPG